MPFWVGYFTVKAAWIAFAFSSRLTGLSDAATERIFFGLIAAIPMVMIVACHMQKSRRRAFALEFRGRLRDRDGNDVADRLLVGMEELQPTTIANTGAANWDLGYLAAGDGLSYCDDQASFHIAAQDVLWVRVRGFLRPHLVAKVRLDGRGQPVKINFTPWSAESRTTAYTALQQIRIALALPPRSEERRV